MGRVSVEVSARVSVRKRVAIFYESIHIFSSECVGPANVVPSMRFVRKHGMFVHVGKQAVRVLQSVAR